MSRDERDPEMPQSLGRRDDRLTPGEAGERPMRRRDLRHAARDGRADRRDVPVHAAAPEPGRSAWATLARVGRPRLTRANVAATVLTGLLGFALATQVQSTSKQGLDALRTPDLVRILGDQNARAARLDTDVRQLEQTREQLTTGDAGGKEAVARAQSQLDDLGILTGTAKATGPGITMTISQPGDIITYANLLDIVEELRDAGAEAIQVGDARVVASTAFTMKDGAIHAGSTKLAAPYVVKAVGDPATLESAMRIPGGIVETLEQMQASVAITTSAKTGKPIMIDAVVQPPSPRYAHPVPAPSSPTP